MAFFLSRRWKRQPQGEVEIDWSHPLAQGLQAFWLPTGYRGPGLRVAPTSAAVSARASATDSGGYVLPPTLTISAAAGTIVFGGHIDSGATSEYFWDSEFDGLRDLFYRKSNGTFGWYVGISEIADTTGIGSGLLTGPAPVNVALRWASGAQAIFRNGALFETRSVSIGSASSARRIRLASRFASNEGLLSGGLTHWGIYSRQLLGAEIAESGENPWQILRPRTLRIYSLGPAGEPGATILNNYVRPDNASQYVNRGIARGMF